MKPVLIIGAGFSGLTLAYSLRKLGLQVRIIERAPKAGGLLGSRKEQYGLVETAANAVLSDADVEALFNELEVPFAKRFPTRKRRYIYWKKPSRWPVSFATTLKILKIPLSNLFGLNGVNPIAGETVSNWAKRVINPQFEERMLAPALQGIYAGDITRMSAPLTLNSLFRKSKRGRMRGSVAPRAGMGVLIAHLEKTLKGMDVSIEYGVDYRLPEKLEQPTVICTSAWAASEVVGAHDPALANMLATCESLPMLTVTAFFVAHEKDLKGFGCLFAEGQGFQTLGVLFNDSIFEDRSTVGIRSETWMLGGAKNLDVNSLSDEQVLAKISEDRIRLNPAAALAKPLSVHVTRWPRAIPHYTVEWEERLRNLKVNRPLFLHGNYLGQLGLARILHRSKALAAQLKDLYVS